MSTSAPTDHATLSAAAERLVARLGHAGLLPFALLALLLWVVAPEAQAFVALAMVAYAALVASFLGGIHWGVVWLKLATPDHPSAGIPRHDALHHHRQHLVWGVAPSLLAWPGVLMPAHAALPWLGLVLVLAYLVDRRLYPEAGLGHWLTLRFRLSMGAALSCFLGAGAV